MSDLEPRPPISSGGYRPETVAVSAGRPAPAVDAPLNQPPVLASTYVGTPDVGRGELGYGRYGNPGWQALEETIGALEGGRALTFSSGMAAVQAALELAPPRATVVVPTTCYLGVLSAAEQRAARHEWTLRRVDVSDTAATLAAADGADLVWVESPTNPMIAVADVPALGAALAGRVPLVVDSTVASPLLQRPLQVGADVVVHAATKLLSGHSDALLGAVVVAPHDRDRFDRLLATRSLHGAVPGALEAYLVLRGLRTLPVRLARASATAGELARRLSEHPGVRQVHYPGLPGDPSHEVAVDTLAGFGSLISVELAGAVAAEALVAATRLWVFTTSFGGVESTCERRRRWPTELVTVPKGLVRLSVGLEHVEDLWADLEQALDAAVGG